MDLDYSHRNPTTYAVFIPGVSYVVQKIHTADLLPKIKTGSPDFGPLGGIDQNAHKKFAEVCKWHLRGSLTQMMVAVVAVQIFSSSIFTWLGLIAMFECADTLYRGMTNTVALVDGSKHKFPDLCQLV